MDKKIFKAGQICRKLTKEGQKSKEVYVVLQDSVQKAFRSIDAYLLICGDGNQEEYDGELAHARSDSEFLQSMKELAVERANLQKALEKQDDTITKALESQRKSLGILTDQEFLSFVNEQLYKKANGYNVKSRIYNGNLWIDFRKEDYGLAERMCAHVDFFEKEYDGAWFLASDAEKSKSYQEFILKGRKKVSACSDKGGFFSSLMELKRTETLGAVGDSYKGNFGYFDEFQGCIKLPSAYTKDFVKNLAKSIKYKN